MRHLLLIVLSQLSLLIGTNLTISPIFLLSYENQGGEWAPDTKPVYTLGGGISYFYQINDVTIQGSFTNNRFFGLKGNPNRFNRKQGIGYISTHELTGKKRDYDIATMEIVWIKNQFEVFLGTDVSEWSPGSTSILLSNTPPPYPSFGYQWKVKKNLKINSVLKESHFK